MKRKVSKPVENSQKKAKMENPLETLLENGTVQEFFKFPELEEKILGQIHSEKLWTKLHGWISEALLKILENQKDEPAEKILKNCVHLIRTILETVTDTFDVPNGLSQTLPLLHQSLPTLKSQDQLKNEISRTLETYFSKNLPDKNLYIPNVVQFLLHKSVQSNGMKNDIKRLQNLDIDFKNQSLRPLLLKTVNPNYYKNEAGQKFIANLLGSQAELCTEVHKAFKTIIPGCSKSDGHSIGEIYMKSWSIHEENKEAIEDSIQNFMYHCILAKKKSKIFEPLLALLNAFHINKKNKDVQSLVHRLWEPLLWRYLKVANADVRGNAVQILAEAFPLEDPNSELEVRAAAQESQVQILLELLKDDVPEVRVQAIQAVTLVLSRFWIIFSATDIQSFMTVFINQLANDMSSPKVRQTVIKSLIKLIKTCPRSHVYLKKILPKLRDCLFDTNETVRVAMLDLLLAVKNIKTIQFWSICPIEDLLDRLAKDKKNLAQKIVSLLFNSFFPLDQNEEGKIERAVYLVKNQVDASRRFYLYLERLSGLHDTVKFMLAVLVNLKRKAQELLQESQEYEDKENINTNNIADKGDDHEPHSGPSNESTVLKDGSIRLANDTLHHSLGDVQVVQGLIDIVCVLWMSRCQELAEPKNAEYRSLLEKKSSKILTLLFKVYKSCSVHRSVIYLSSFLPHSAALTTVSFCLSRLKSADIEELPVEKYLSWNKNEAINAEFTTYVDALCNWRRGDDVLEMINDWLVKSVAAKKPKKSRGVRFNESESSRPGFGLLLLKYLLGHTLNRSILLRKNQEHLETIKETLKEFLPKFKEAFGEKEEDKINIEGKHAVLGSVWTMLLQLELVLHLNKKPEDHEELFSTMETYQKFAKDAEVYTSSLALHVVKTMMMMSSNLVTLNITDMSMINSTLEISKCWLSQGMLLEKLVLFD